MPAARVGRANGSTSNSRTASSALFDCSRPIMCSLRPGLAAASAGHLSAASWTRFSPKSGNPGSDQRLRSRPRCAAWSRRPASRRPPCAARSSPRARSARGHRPGGLRHRLIGAGYRKRHGSEPAPMAARMADDRRADGRAVVGGDRPASGRRPAALSSATIRSMLQERCELGQGMAAVGARRAELVLAVGARRRTGRASWARSWCITRDSAGDLPFSRSVHDEEEARARARGGAALVFISPGLSDAVASRARLTLGLGASGQAGGDRHGMPGHCAGRNG